MADETNIQTHEHDVLVIGAGGAGLRAAIEASAGGVSVGLVCTSRNTQHATLASSCLTTRPSTTTSS